MKFQKAFEASAKLLNTIDEMLDKAKADHPDWHWQQADIAHWAKWHTAGPFELVFSNAAFSFQMSGGSSSSRKAR